MAFSNVYRMNVDTKRRLTSVVPTFKQGDNGELRFKIYDEGRLFDLSDYTHSEITFKLPNGDSLVGNPELIDGELVYYFNRVEMSVVGKVETVLSIMSGDSMVSLQPFTCFIFDSMKTENLSYVGILQELIKETQNQGLSIEGVLNQVGDTLGLVGDELNDLHRFVSLVEGTELTRNTNENTRQSNEQDRFNSELQRIRREDTRVSNESTRVNAEDVRIQNESTRQSNEIQRQNRFTAKINEFEGKINVLDEVKALPYHYLTTYRPPNFVTYNGSTYIVLQPVTGVTPSDDGINYRLAAQRGVDGTGSVSTINGIAPNENGDVELSFVSQEFIDHERNETNQMHIAAVTSIPTNLANAGIIMKVDGAFPTAPEMPTLDQFEEDVREILDDYSDNIQNFQTEVNQQLAQTEELVLGVGLMGESYPRLPSENDDAPRIRRAIADAETLKIGTIRFASKTIRIASTIEVPSAIHLEGTTYESGSSGTLGTRVIRTANVVAINIIGDSVLVGQNKRNVKMRNIYFDGGDYFEDFMIIRGAGQLLFEDCHFMAMSGRQLLLHEVMDSRFTNCVFEWGGNTSGTVPAVDLKSGDGYEYTNQIHFVGCRWESYRGTALATSGVNTNEIFITNCKFESLHSNVPHIKLHGANIIYLDGVNICSKGNVGNTLPCQLEILNSRGVFGTLLLEHTGTIDTNAAKIKEFVNVKNSSNLDFYTYVYQNGNNVLSSSCVVVDDTNNDYDISITGAILGDNYTKTICNTPVKSRSTLIRNKNPYIRFSRPDVLLEYWDHGRVIPDGTKTKYQFIHGDNTLGERPIFEINANSDFRIFRDLMMEGRAIHLSQLSSPPYGRNGSMYYDNSSHTIKAYINGAWRTLNFT